MGQVIIQGDALVELKKMADESVDCCITSPPYFALRVYGTTPQIWGGDSNCQHEWNKIFKPPMGGKNPEGRPANVGSNKMLNDSNLRGIGTYSDFCSFCLAWRGSLGLEPTFELYLKHLLQIFDEVKRVLKKTGTCFVNIGDTYSGTKIGKTDKKVADYVKESQNDLIKKCKEVPAKSLCLIPQRFAIAMVDRGWVCRNQIIWYKRNCMPASVKDRFTVDFEYVFFFVRSKKYFFETQFENLTCPQRYRTRLRAVEKINTWKRQSMKTLEALMINPKTIEATRQRGLEKGRNKRCVWDITTKPFKGPHLAMFPEALVEPMIKSGSPPEGVVLDPFAGAATTLVVAKKLGRDAIGIELNLAYVQMGQKRLDNTQGSLFTQNTA